METLALINTPQTHNRQPVEWLAWCWEMKLMQLEMNLSKKVLAGAA